MVYKSEISWGLLGPIVVLLGGMCVFFAYNKVWSSFFIMVPVIGFILHLFTSTYYTISRDALNVHSGFLVNIDIEIASIRKIEATNSMLSAPALSLNRIEVFYNRFDSVVISPSDKDGFVAALKAINAGIEVKP